MGTLPTFISTAQAPSTTGVGSLDFVPLQDDTGKQLQQLGGLGQKIAANIFQIQNEQALSHSNINAKVKLSGLRTELSKMDPNQALSVAGSRIQAIYEESSQGLSSNALDEFNKSFGLLRAEASIKIQADSVKNIADKAKGNLEIQLNAYAKMFNPLDGVLEKQKAFIEAIKDINALVKSDALSIEAGAKRMLKFKEEFVKTGIDHLIRETPTDKLDELVGQMATDKIIDPAFKSFWGQLDDTEKLKLQAKTVRMHEHQLNIIDKSKRRDIFYKIQNQAKQTASFKKLIIEQKRSEKPSLKDITQDELLDALEGNKIDYKQYLDLSADLINKDPEGSDTDVIKTLFANIREATSPDALKDIIKEAEGKLGTKGKLTFEAFKVIEARALAAMQNTPAEREKRRYSAALEKIVSSADWLDKILPGAKDRAALIMLDFEARISGVNSEPPAEAFKNALDAFRTRGTVELNAIPRPQYGPVDKKLGDWTLDDVLQAKAMTRAKYKGKPSVLATQMIMLNALEQYISAQTATPELEVEVGKQWRTDPKKTPTNKKTLDALRGGK